MTHDRDGKWFVFPNRGSWFEGVETVEKGHGRVGVSNGRVQEEQSDQGDCTAR